VIREAMRGKGMVVLARVVLSKRKRVVMLQPWDKGLMGTTLRYPYEIRDAKEYFDDISNVKVAPDMLKLAEHILQSMQSRPCGRKKPDRSMNRKVGVVAALALLLCAGATPVSEAAYAEEIDFGHCR
jgi:non-homologous end joining protein Ku